MTLLLLGNNNNNNKNKKKNPILNFLRRNYTKGPPQPPVAPPPIKLGRTRRIPRTKLTLPPRGGGYIIPPLAELIIAPKGMRIIFQNFLIFP